MSDNYPDNIFVETVTAVRVSGPSIAWEEYWVPTSSAGYFMVITDRPGTSEHPITRLVAPESVPEEVMDVFKQFNL